MSLSIKIANTKISRVSLGSAIVTGQNTVTARNVSCINSGSTVLGDGLVIQGARSRVNDPDYIDSWSHDPDRDRQERPGL